MPHKRKYPLNEEYFETWSHDMAYILGFISADGSVNKQGSLSIELQLRDIEVLEFIRQQISPTSPIKITKKKNKEYCRLRINSQTLIQSLQKYNIIPNKTFSIKLDFDIPQQFTGDYVRGLFDGDGWICCRRNGIETGFASHQKEYLQSLKYLINIGNIHENKKITKSGKLSIWFSWDMYKNDSIKLRNIMYASGGFSLKRKQDIFYSNFYTPSPRWWTEEQLNYLKDNYVPGQSPQIIADAIGKPYKSVSKKIWELNLRKIKTGLE